LNGTVTVRRQERAHPPIPSTPRRQITDLCNKASDGKQGLMVGYWWLTVFPGCCIMLMVLSANLIGDWLRVKFDPQLRQL
jgi:ABC-type dipeptide/oligopeptide/nickel transport system permease subunit